MTAQEKLLGEKRRGRPAIGKGTQANLTLRPDLVAALDRACAECRTTRVGLIRAVLTDWLRANGYLSK